MPTTGVTSLGRVRSLAVLFALALLAAACSSEKQAAPTTTHAVPATLKAPPPPPPKRTKVHVIVYDGDTGEPVPKARVQVGRFAGRTDRPSPSRISRPSLS